ncbi:MULTISPECIES: DedA family protein [unclassified Lebetimonas]|uniref:DedA family protein n=1 Tax=unclassified Lebetimonas TaxID=2648158 RepID=UPI000466584F|nr:MULTISPECIES: DedA family protein [unclassified Lebetimonas]
MLNEIINFLVNFAHSLGYIGIYFYMLLVGTFIPVPSELVLLPAGYLAATGKMNLISVWLCAALGSLSGALINYFLAKFLVNKILKDKPVIEKVTKFWKNHGKISAFLAPLTPGLGQYISIPAGLSHMPLKWFIPLTFSANLIWTGFLIMVGFLFGTGEKAHKSAVFGSLILLGSVIIIATVYVFSELKKTK